MINLEDKYIDFIKKTISKYLGSFEVYLYGSRVKGTSKKYSDVDIPLLSDELTEDIKSKINIDFENSTFPFKVDIIDLKTISDDFKILIKNTLVKI